MRIKTPKSWVTQFDVIEHNLVVRFSNPRRVISSAVRGGGIGWAHAIINHQVPQSLPHSKKESSQSIRWEDPARALGKIADRLGLSGRCVGLMTGVDLRHLILAREQVGKIWIEGFFTIGVTNAVRAGESASDHSQWPGLGTINIILVTNAKLSMAALVGAVAVTTESKTASLFQAQVMNAAGSELATGTGTDSMVIAIGDGPRLRYSGTHTTMGELIGRVVARGMGQGLAMIRSSKK